MREQKAAIIVEGYFDHLALYRAGIRNVVATCGTALTSGHLQVLKRYAERFYLLFDADNAFAFCGRFSVRCVTWPSCWRSSSLSIMLPGFDYTSTRPQFAVHATPMPRPARHACQR